MVLTDAFLAWRYELSTAAGTDFTKFLSTVAHQLIFNDYLRVERPKRGGGEVQEWEVWEQMRHIIIFFKSFVTI